MEFPDNVEIALAMEGAIRGEGTHPATISIIRGRITVGLTAEQIEAFGTAEGIAKCSRRDLPVVISAGQDGSLTVAGNGILIAVPVPEKSALDRDEVSAAIDEAVREADEQAVFGNQLTPFLLKRVVELTDGRALAANKALLLNNAETAAVLARRSV